MVLRNILGVIVILACLSSFIRFGYSIYPFVIINLQIVMLIIQNKYVKQ
jgi:hypothetical protein